MQIDHMRAQLNAIRRWFFENRSKLMLGSRAEMDFLNMLNHERFALDHLAGMLKDMKNDLSIESALLKVGGDLPIRDDIIRMKYRQMQKAHESIYRKIRHRLPDDVRSVVERLFSIYGRADELHQKIYSFYSEIDDSLRGMILKTRAKILSEQETLKQLINQKSQLDEQTRFLGGKVAYEAFRRVRKKFHDMLLRAEVGQLDVAWQKKHMITERIKSVSKSMKDELDSLKEEFEECMVQLQ
jgi:gas vesicle protein